MISRRSFIFCGAVALLPLPADPYDQFLAAESLLPTIRGRKGRSMGIAVRLAYLGTSPTCAAWTTDRLLPGMFKCYRDCANFGL
jgi:hypothetical protein